MLAHGYDYGRKWNNEDLSKNKDLEKLAQRTPLNTVYRYYGTGDIGGSPTLGSVRSVEQGIKGDGPVEVISTPTTHSCQLFIQTFLQSDKLKMPPARPALWYSKLQRAPTSNCRTLA